MDKKYNIIYADPPWHYSSGLRSSKKIGGKFQYYTPSTTVGAAYTTMTLDALMRLPVGSIAADNCILFLWTTDSHLPQALEVIKAWGFQYKTIGFIWNKKEKSGKQVCYYGHWTMKGSEICLLATKGRMHQYIQSHKVRQLVEAPRDKTTHSRKPDEVRDRIVQLMGDLPRIELFAREKTEGWDVWGDEVESDVVLGAGCAQSGVSDVG
jgi:site-specific DNA-methyltransferase (adenine-specific)